MDNNIRHKLRANFVVSFFATVVVVLIVFSFFVKEENTIFTLSGEFPEVIVIVVLLETILQIMVNRSRIPKSKEAVKNIAIYLLISTIVIGGIVSFTPIGLIYILAPDFVMGRITYLILKAVVTSFAGAAAWTYAMYYFTDIFSG